jgi:hypothetical protein
MIRKLLAVFGLALAFSATSAAARPAVSVAPVPVRSASDGVAAITPACRRGYYEDASGVCVRRPSKDPRGATAKCRDGTYSYSRHASGTCSHHGGVARWIRHP